MKKRPCLCENIFVMTAVIMLLFVNLSVLVATHIEQKKISNFYMLKEYGHAICRTIMLANNERTISGHPSLLPGDLADQGITFANAEAYFTYLMSDGTDTQIIAENPNARLVPDLHPRMLAFGSMPEAKAGAPVLPQNNVWHVVNVATNALPEIPFLVTRNVRASAITYPTLLELENDENVLTPINIDTTVIPFKRVYWAALGGNSSWAPSTKITRSQLCPIPKPESAPELTVLPAQDGYH